MKKYYGYIDNNRVYPTIFANNVDIQGLLNQPNSRYIEVDFELDPKKCYSIKNGVVFEDIELMQAEDTQYNKGKIKELIEQTNKYMISDAKLFYDKNFLDQVKLYRKALVDIYQKKDVISSSDIPEMPIEKGLLDV